jgi:hypothetical protein
MRWSYYIADSPWRDGDRWDSHSHEEMTRRANFLVDRRMDIAMHNMMPIADALPTLGNTLYTTADGRLVTATALLMAAFVAPYGSEPADAAILDLAGILGQLPERLPHESALYFKLAFTTFAAAAELDSLSADARISVLKTLHSRSFLLDPDILRLLDRLLDLLADDLPATAPTPPALAASPLPAPSPAVSSPATRAMPPVAP